MFYHATSPVKETQDINAVRFVWIFTSYKWIRAWLKDRWQRVKLSGVASGWIEVLSGVPQGSVLGPLLFLIFINDLDLDAARAAIVVKFADDTKVAQPISTEEDRNSLQVALDGLVH